MITIKHFAMMAATALMALAATACGDNDEPDTPGSQPITGGKTTTATTTTSAMSSTSTRPKP